jgi:predicted phosphoribosyltransferase
MGAVADGGRSIIVRNEDVIEHVGIDEAELKAVCDAEFAEIERRRERAVVLLDHIAQMDALHVVDPGSPRAASFRNTRSGGRLY